MADDPEKVGRVDLVTAEQSEFPDWRERRSLPLSAMAAWSEADWAQWWADGVRIWYSDFRAADRREAFAPILLDIERDRPEERLPDQLAHFYDAPPTQEAAHALAIQSAMERGMLRLLNNRHFMESAKVPMLALRIFSALPSRFSGEMVHSILEALGKEWLDPEAEEDLIPTLAYSIHDFVDPSALDDVRLHFESLLARQAGHDAPLIYAIAMSHGEIAVALATFERLWTGERALGARGVWEAVADELDRHFGKERVARELKQIISNAPALSREGMDAVVPAMRLQHCYPAPGRPIGLSGLLSKEGLRSRILSARRGLSTGFEPSPFEAATACG